MDNKQKIESKQKMDSKQREMKNRKREIDKIKVSLENKKGTTKSSKSSGSVVKSSRSIVKSGKGVVKSDVKSVKKDKVREESPNIFRKSSLARLSSPEHLDKMITVTDPLGWLALFGALFLVSITIIWSFLGSLPTKVQGAGVLIKSGGLKSIQHSSSGMVTDINISPGDIVNKGDVIARVEASSLVDRISSARFELSNIKDSSSRYLQYFDKNRDIQRRYFEVTKSSKEESIRDLERDIEEQKRVVDIQYDLFNEGGISREEVKISQQKLDNLESMKAQEESELSQITIGELNFNKEHEDRVTQYLNEIKEKEREIAYLQDQLESQSKIVSLYSGRVISTLFGKGSIIGAGQKIASIEIEGRDVRELEGVIFLPAIQAKKVEVGMEVEISPSTVNSSEYGIMLGRVTKVDDYPASFEYISSLLGDEMASKYSRMDDPVEVKVDLIVDRDSRSGFKWSSKKGPPVKVKSGTPATAEIKVKDQRPITMILPVLSQLLD